MAQPASHRPGLPKRREEDDDGDDGGSGNGGSLGADSSRPILVEQTCKSRKQRRGR